MGWSCSAKASKTIDLIVEWMKDQEGDKSQNVWIDKDRKFMWESSRREYPGGDIMGTVWEFYPDHHEWAGHVHRVGSFHVDGNGRIVRFSHLPMPCKTYVRFN